ncbi:hypothetical protein LEP1GSC198_2466 [Leptospira kirschneri str. JB]|nr:hypothetical protein LEP1GSC198_2466 [Leptospira kirschneri str. JB]
MLVASRIRLDFLTSISLTLELSQNRPFSVFLIKPNQQLIVDTFFQKLHLYTVHS